MASQEIGNGRTLPDMPDNVLKIVFQCPEHEIDGRTFTQTFIGFSRLIWAVNSELNTGRQLNIRIRATEQGSFAFDIQLVSTVLDSLKNLFSSTDGNIIPEVIFTVAAILGLAKQMEGEDEQIAAEPIAEVAQSGSQANIPITGNNNVVNIDQRTINIYHDNKEVRSSVKEISEAIASDPEVTALDLQNTKKETLFSATSGEFAEMLEHLTTEAKPPSRVVTRREELAVIKPSLNSRYAWSFGYQGFPIQAVVDDEGFNSKIQSRQELFGAGDLLIVELEQIQELDRKNDFYATKKYRVVKVHDHLRGGDGNRNGSLGIDGD